MSAPAVGKIELLSKSFNPENLPTKEEENGFITESALTEDVRLAPGNPLKGCEDGRSPGPHQADAAFPPGSQDSGGPWS